MVGGQSSAAYPAYTCPEARAEGYPGRRGGVGVGPTWAGNRGPIPALFVRVRGAWGSVFVDPKSTAYRAHTCPLRGEVEVGPTWAGKRGPIPELFVRAHLAWGSVFVDPKSTAYRADTCPQSGAECSPGFRGEVEVGPTRADNRAPIPELFVRAHLAWGSVFVDSKSTTYQASPRPAVPVGWFVGRRATTVAGPNSTRCCIFSAWPEAPVEPGPRLHNVLAPHPGSMACRMARRPYAQIANYLPTGQPRVHSAEAASTSSFDGWGLLRR
ncbi:Uncharacterised protein [Pandoraea pulmonicola]|uniref:Uncharacterized protein n=1 Tax=Pandoraea pulmonicola TaxID=93221 RepID=A0AAJ5D1N7_PANPU|nr:Uncharacterised protein [Pandoraea pulmonicola]